MAASLVLCAAACAAASAQAFGQQAVRPAQAGTGVSVSVPASAGEKKTEEESKLTPEEEKLVRDSKAAIIETGFSEGYFDAHFKSVKVHNSAGDRRIVWRFRLNEYETIINDSIGFYTDERGRRVDSHAVSASLGKTRDIRRTISFRRARRAMKACIGEHDEGAVLLQASNADGRVSLVFTATSLPPPAAPANSVSSAGQPTLPPDADDAERDRLKPGGKKKPFLSIGSINLETGRCVKGLAQVGSPQPTPAPVPQRRR